MSDIDKIKLIDSILDAMAVDLQPEALRKLENVIVIQLQGVRLEAECTELVVSKRHWERALKTWLATKKLENCSVGTLANYGRCLKMMLKRLNKKLRDITANDLRYYLAMYQEERPEALEFKQ